MNTMFHDTQVRTFKNLPNWAKAKWFSFSTKSRNCRPFAIRNHAIKRSINVCLIMMLMRSLHRSEYVSHHVEIHTNTLILKIEHNWSEEQDSTMFNFLFLFFCFCFFFRFGPLPCSVFIVNNHHRYHWPENI